MALRLRLRPQAQAQAGAGVGLERQERGRGWSMAGAAGEWGSATRSLHLGPSGFCCLAVRAAPRRSSVAVWRALAASCQFNSDGQPTLLSHMRPLQSTREIHPPAAACIKYEHLGPLHILWACARSHGLATSRIGRVCMRSRTTAAAALEVTSRRRI